MGNRYRAMVDVQAADGSTRRLRYDLNAMVELEERFGIRDLAGFGDLLSRATFRDIRTLLWIGLRYEDPDLTEHEVGSWFGDGNLTVLEAAEKIALAMAQAFGVDVDPLALRAAAQEAMAQQTTPPSSRGTGTKRKRSPSDTSA